MQQVVTGPDDCVFVYDDEVQETNIEVSASALNENINKKTESTAQKPKSGCATDNGNGDEDTLRKNYFDSVTHDKTNIHSTKKKFFFWTDVKWEASNETGKGKCFMI